MNSIELSDGWRVTEVVTATMPEHRHLPWVPATVPGHLYEDLVRAGIAPDVSSRLYERSANWVDEVDWVYENRFHLDRLSTDNVILRFNGLDTIAEVELNGCLLGTSDNMFVPLEFTVGDRLNVGRGTLGDNLLRVTLRSASRVGRERQKAWDDGGNPSMPYHWFVWSERAFVRKAQYMYGWDWGPTAASPGIWKSVELIQSPHGRLLDYAYTVDFLEGGAAKVTVEAFVERNPATVDEELTIGVTVENGRRLTSTAVVPHEAGRISAKAEIIIEKPELWWPNGLGEAMLYPVDIELIAGRVVDRVSGTIGLRTIELITEPDTSSSPLEEGPGEVGESFKFRVNGRDVYIKGANWIPTTIYPSREEIGDLIRASRDAGFNMLRVWGGGLYESHEFYRQCDQHGIMVWQDFGYTCSFYPDTGDYAENARVEAVENVRRLRRHPSLAIWCGNNEIDVMYRTSDGTLPPRFLGEPIFHEILPEVVAAEDPGRIYWPASPFGGKDPNSPNIGDVHNWEVWHGKGDWIHYADNHARFVSEFGFAGSCGLAAWSTCLVDDDRSAKSAAVRWHDKTRLGYDKYFALIAKHFPEPETLEDLVYYSQINQAEAMKFGIEHYRRIKGHCWGALVWQLNDCNPAQSWSLIDSAGERKAAYFAVKHAYAPVLLSLVRDGDDVIAHLVNDNYERVGGDISFRLEDVSGRLLHTQRDPVSVDANVSTVAARFNVSTALGHERSTVVHAEFIPSTGAVPGQRNVLFLCEPKELDVSKSRVSITGISPAGPHCFVTLQADGFAPYVWLRHKDDAVLDIDDNFFHMRPGERRAVRIAHARDLGTPDELLEKLTLRTLGMWVAGSSERTSSTQV